MTIALLIAFLGSLTLVGEPDAEQPAKAAANDPADTADIPWRGMAIQLTNGRDAMVRYPRLIREVRELGANTLLLSVAAYMEHARAQAVFVDARRTPSPEHFVELIKLAHAQDLRVIVMPIVLLKHPRGSEWRGVIDPPNWDEWWQQYRDFIKYFADIAREGRAEAFLVGSELVSTEKQTKQWETTIHTARAHYPTGMLGYSANWDHYKPIEFWHMLDFVGMTSYYTLADDKNPTVEQIVARWQPIRAEVREWLRKVDKPLILTEVGWCSQEGAATAPWNYYQNMKATPSGHEEQRRLYEGFLQAWQGTPEVRGVIWWEWTSEEGGASDFNYTPRGKPAEKLLRGWYGELPRKTTSQPVQMPITQPASE